MDLLDGSRDTRPLRKLCRTKGTAAPLLPSHNESVVKDHQFARALAPYKRNLEMVNKGVILCVSEFSRCSTKVLAADRLGYFGPGSSSGMRFWPP